MHIVLQSVFFALNVKDSSTSIQSRQHSLKKTTVKYCVGLLSTGILFPKEAENFLCHVKTIRPIHPAPGTVSLGIKWPG